MTQTTDQWNYQFFSFKYTIFENKRLSSDIHLSISMSKVIYLKTTTHSDSMNTPMWNAAWLIANFSCRIADIKWERSGEVEDFYLNYKTNEILLHTFQEHQKWLPSGKFNREFRATTVTVTAAATFEENSITNCG